jgi:cytochrome c peroxidase
MYAIGRFVYALEPPANPNKPDAQSARGEQVFRRAGCGSCHTPPLYTNNKLVPVDGFSRLDHPLSPPAADVMTGTRVGLDSGLALRTRKGTGYYKVPSLRGLWYRDTLEHSGSMQSLEEWFDPARLTADYSPKGFNPPGVKTRPVPGHQFGLRLPVDDKRALLVFLRTL